MLCCADASMAIASGRSTVRSSMHMTGIIQRGSDSRHLAGKRLTRGFADASFCGIGNAKWALGKMTRAGAGLANEVR